MFTKLSRVIMSWTAPDMLNITAVSPHMRYAAFHSDYIFDLSRGCACMINFVSKWNYTEYFWTCDPHCLRRRHWLRRSSADLESISATDQRHSGAETGTPPKARRCPSTVNTQRAVWKWQVSKQVRTIISTRRSKKRTVHNAPWSDCPNKNVFSDRLNQEYGDSAFRKSAGKLFQTLEAAAAKVLSAKQLEVRWTTQSSTNTCA